MENQIQKVKCPLCGGYSVWWTKKNLFSLFKCQLCGLIFVHPMPDSSSVYTDDYFSGAEKGFGYVDYNADKEPMIPTFEKYLDHIEALGITGGKLLDVGCATGFFMELCQKRGWDATGVEISDFAVEIGQEKGLRIFTETLQNRQFSDGEFDVVTMCDVLEHVADTKSFLSEYARVLRPGGLLVINTPNASSFPARVFGKHWHLIVPPEHLCYFSSHNLTDFLQKNGFKVEENTSIGKRFTLSYIFKTLYKWQKLKVWDYLSTFFSKTFLSRLYVPLNTHDNMFIIARKKK